MTTPREDRYLRMLHLRNRFLTAASSAANALGHVVWGAICGERRSLVRFLQQQPRGVLYQYDNTRPHTARIVQNFFPDSNVDVLPWPSEWELIPADAIK